MTTAELRREMTGEAEAKRSMALKAHRQGDRKLRDAFLQQAADRYRAAGMTGMANGCLRFVGR